MFKIKTILTILCIALIGAPLALAQKEQDPNLNHFYMGRQQITIEDDSPIIKRKAGAAAPSGSLPATQPLPEARWEQYSPADTQAPSTSLPKVNNGVPKPAPKAPKVLNGLKGKSIKLKGQSKSLSQNADTKSAQKAATYEPYKKYASNSTANKTQSESSAKVHGNVLHWARKQPSY